MQFDHVDCLPLDDFEAEQEAKWIKADAELDALKRAGIDGLTNHSIVQRDRDAVKRQDREFFGRNLA